MENKIVAGHQQTHSAEIAHDTKLLELLRSEAAASSAHAVAAALVRDAVCVYRADIVDRPRAFRDPTYKADGRIVLLQTAVTLLEELADPAVAETVAASYADLRTIYASSWWDPKRAVADALGTAARLRAAYDDLKAARALIDDHETAYTGWNRYFLVVSSDGLVHSTMKCSTCYETTRFAPLPSLSGASLDETVALVGSALCSTCYPLAPTDWADGAKVTGKVAAVLLNEGEDAFRAKLAELAAKRAERCDADPYDHDGAGAHLYRAWGRCNKCGAGVSLTKTGKMRSHSPKAKS